MDYLGLLEEKQWIEISEDFNYLKATQDFIGLKLFPMFKTDNMKLAVADLVSGSEIPVMAFVHALDTEARIGNRPDFKEIDFELLLVKEKLNQGEALRKKLKDLGMSNEERKIMNAVYDDASHLIAKVLTRFEVMACEALSTGMLDIHENDVELMVDYHIPEKNRLVVSDWKTSTHDILGDLVKIRKVSKNKIVRALTSDKIMGYITANNKLQEIATKQGTFVTEDWAKNYIMNYLGIEFVVVDGTYKTDEKDTEEHNFFDDSTITFLTTNGTLGNTFVTSSPEEDYGIAQSTNGFVSITQWKTTDPAGVWTKASAIAFPAFRDVKQVYICKVKA
ncbi:MAG: major capsid protein [Christensenellales bacterium]